MAKRLIKVGDFISSGVRLGEGSFGIVYFGQHKKTKIPVAIKELDLDKLDKLDPSHKLLTHLANEITIMKKINNMNVVRLLEHKKQNKKVYLVIEYCKLGTFEDYLKKHPENRLPEDEVQYFMQQFGMILANGLKALRELKVIHRDLKPENLLLSESNGNIILKISDFGFARTTENNILVQTICGTPLYSAPEIVLGQHYTVKSDLWSIGVIMYQMIYGKTLYPTITSLQELIHSVKFAPILFYNSIPISNECRDLLEKLLQRDANLRMSWDEFFAHPFVYLPPVEPENNNNINISNGISKSNNNSIYSSSTEEKNEDKEDDFVVVQKDHEELLQISNNRIEEQYLQSLAVAKLAKEFISIGEMSGGLSLYCKALENLQSTLNCALNCREFIDHSDPLFLSFSEKIEKMKEKFGEYLKEAESLSQRYQPAHDVERLIFSKALNYSQQGLREEIEKKNYILSIELYSFSAVLLAQLKSDAVQETDKEVLSNYLAEIQTRLDKLSQIIKNNCN